MRRKIILILTLLLISDDVFGKNGNKTKQIRTVHKKNNSKNKVNSAREKRSLDNGIEKLFSKENLIDDSNQYDYLDGKGRNLKPKSAVEKEFPFWGSRGRRESLTDETVPDVQLPTPKHNKYNKNLYKLLLNLEDKSNEEVPPFWSTRRRRDSDKSKEDDMPQDLFWATRGRRQEEEPFWGTRGRREEEESPFWGNRGRRGNLVSPNWSSKEEFDDDAPFWGNRGRREEEEPFWGNRGRREEEEPFWGNRGRREEEEPFWGNRGRREQFEPYSGPEKNKAKSHYSSKNLLNHEKYLKDAIIDSIDDVRNYNDNFDRNRRYDIQAPYWMNRGRNSKIRSLFNCLGRNRMQYNPNTYNKVPHNERHSKSFQQNTVHDGRMYAEEPHYILVERSSRSSAEDDPFYISRGKKYKSNLAKAVRGRRGALEDIMKSVRNDPYNIARGKKDYKQIANSNITESQFINTRDLICASVDLLAMKHSEGNKVKREVVDNERDRRTTLNKLALQLQMDPYYVSRGKKDGEHNINMDDVEQLINKIIVLCN